MALNFLQSGGASTNSPLCSGDSPSTTSGNCLIELNETNGTTHVIQIQGLQLDPVFGYTMISGTNTPYLTTWDSGDWVVRLQMGNPGDSDCTLEDIHICRVDAENVSVATVTNRTSLGLTLQTNVLRTVTFTNVGEVSADVTNRVGIVLSFANNVAALATIAIRENQYQDTPLVIPPLLMSGTSA